jgi:ribosomal protein L37AE/L43A
MFGAVYHCPYCGIGGQYKSMIPLGQSDNYTCRGCRHTIVEGDLSYVCSCSNCKARRDGVELITTASES